MSKNKNVNKNNNSSNGGGGGISCQLLLLVAAWVPDMFWNFNKVKNHKIAKNLATTKRREKISTDLESLEFKEFLMCVWLNLKKESNFT